MKNLYSVVIIKETELQYYRTDFYFEALNLVNAKMNKLGVNIKATIKKLTYNKRGELVTSEIKLDIK